MGDNVGDECDEVMRQACLSARPPFTMLSLRSVDTPILQQGPTCGVVAAVMAAHCLGARDVSLHACLSLAVTRGYSAQGELFSARCVAALMSELLDEVVCGVGGGLRRWQCSVAKFSSAASVFLALAAGGVLLVPYDADKNHWPCCRRGLGAHWSLVCGALLANNTTDHHDEDNVTEHPQLLLVCRHGKSRHPAVWSHRSLSESNSQLTRCRSARANELPYVLCDGSVSAGLRCQCVMVTPSL